MPIGKIVVFLLMFIFIAMLLGPAIFAFANRLWFAGCISLATLPAWWIVIVLMSASAPVFSLICGIGLLAVERWVVNEVNESRRKTSACSEN